jgi:DNA repair exonuclease SbcCD ATPase subunit
VINVNFKKLIVKNFLSVGKNEVIIKFQNGINLLTGINKDNNTRNGVGKSTIIESVYWCLFGSTIRDIKNDKIIHNQQKKGCEVTLKFDVIGVDSVKNSYQLIRSLGPSKVQLLKDDVDITLSTIPANDEFIQKLIGATPEVFNNAVIMTANNTLPFMAQKKIEKRKFIEGILNLNIFTEMLLKARSDFNDTKKQNDILSNNFLNQQKNLNLFENQIVKNKQKKKDKIDNINFTIQKIKDDISSTEKINVPLDDILLKITDNDTKLSKLEIGLTKLDEDILEYSKKQIEYKTYIQNEKNKLKEFDKKKDFCPTCNRKFENLIADNHKCLKEDCLLVIEKNEMFLTDINDKINVKNTKKQEIKQFIFGIKDKNKKLQEEKNSIELKNQKINNFKDKIKEYESQIEELINEKDETNDQIETIEKEICKIEKELEKVKKELSILEEIKFVLSEEGVKTHIIKKLLTLFNQKINFYLKTMDAPCICEFDEMFDEKIVNVYGNECSYFNFSGGERKRIDISVLFAFQDLLRTYSGTSFSLSIYDELFDSAIDEAGIEKIMDILKKRIVDYNECIYIVSHNKNSIKSNFDNILEIEKYNGETVLKT